MRSACADDCRDPRRRSTPPTRRIDGFGAGHVDDRRLDPDAARAAVEHDVDVVAEIVAHVLRRSSGSHVPKRFADGAATPPPNASSSASATGWSGTRMPTVSRPPVASASTRSGLRRTTIVSGPGQNARGERARDVGNVTAEVVELRGARDVHDDGMVGGRPFTAYRRRSASGFAASAPSP